MQSLKRRMNNVYLKLQSTTHVVQFEREDWAEIRNCEEESGKNDDLYTISQPNILKINDDNELNYWLAKFVVEVRRKSLVENPILQIHSIMRYFVAFNGISGKMTAATVVKREQCYTVDVSPSKKVCGIGCNRFKIFQLFLQF